MFIEGRHGGVRGRERREYYYAGDGEGGLTRAPPPGSRGRGGVGGAGQARSGHTYTFFLLPIPGGAPPPRLPTAQGCGGVIAPAVPMAGAIRQGRTLAAATAQRGHAAPGVPASRRPPRLPVTCGWWGEFRFGCLGPRCGVGTLRLPTGKAQHAQMRGCCRRLPGGQGGGVGKGKRRDQGPLHILVRATCNEWGVGVAGGRPFVPAPEQCLGPH